MLRALLDAGVRPDLVVGTSVGRDQRRGARRLPGGRGRGPAGEPVALAGRRRGLRRRHRRPAARAGAHPHRRALRGTAAPRAGRAARRPAHRGPAGAVPVLRRPDRGRRGALVRPRAGRRRRPRLRRGARPAPARSGSAAATTSTAASSTASRWGGPSSWAHSGCSCCRSGASSRPLDRAAQPVGGRRRRVRDRPPAPLRPRPGHGAGRRRGARPARGRRRRAARGTAGRRCATATSRPSSVGSTAPTGRPRPTWSRSSDAPDGAETAAAPLDAPGGARPGDDRADRRRCCSRCRCGCSSRPRRRRCSPAGSGGCACCGS